MRDIFRTAIARLTALYVIVLAFVCIIFSIFIYSLASNEIDRNSRQQVVGFRNMFGRLIIDEEQTEKLRYHETAQSLARLRLKLVIGNVAVIGIGAVLCYWFAKKTLSPVEDGVRAQEKFTSDASHELRTPLASMRAEIEVALRDNTLSAKDAREIMQSNLEEIETMQSMVDNLLLLARNKEISKNELVDVDKLISQVVKSYYKKSLLDKKMVTVDLKPARLSTNKAALNQVISILVDNTLKHAPGSQIKIACRQRPNNVRVTYSDNGPGVSRDDTDHIFDRFYKADLSRSSQKNSGQGLGLAIAKQLVQTMGGEITAKIPKAGGLAFHIDLPLM